MRLNTNSLIFPEERRSIHVAPEREDGKSCGLWPIQLGARLKPPVSEALPCHFHDEPCWECQLTRLS
jgi:hypothetical protein